MFSYKSVLEALVSEAEENENKKERRQKGIKRRNKTSLFTYIYVFRKYKRIINSHISLNPKIPPVLRCILVLLKTKENTVKLILHFNI